MTPDTVDVQGSRACWWDEAGPGLDQCVAENILALVAHRCIGRKEVVLLASWPHPGVLDNVRASSAA